MPSSSDEYGREVPPSDTGSASKVALAAPPGDKADRLAGRFPGGVNEAWEQLSHLSSEGRQFSFNGEAFQVKQPRDHETPESRTLFETLKLLDRKGALGWDFKGENIVIGFADAPNSRSSFLILGTTFKFWTQSRARPRPGCPWRQ